MLHELFNLFHGSLAQHCFTTFEMFRAFTVQIHKNLTLFAETEVQFALSFFNYLDGCRKTLVGLLVYCEWQTS